MSGWTIAAITASAAVSAYGAMQQAQAQRAQANYQAAVARNNAIIAQQNADDAQDRGDRAKDAHNRRLRQIKGKAKVQQAANGFLVDDTEDSTNVMMVADLVEAHKLDELGIEGDTAREVRRAKIQGDNYTAQAGLFSLKASDSSGATAAFGTLLGGAAKAAQVYNA